MDGNGGCNAGNSTSTCIPRYKRRKISAKRNFPPGCGHKVSPINIRHINGSNAGLDNNESANGIKGESNLDSHGTVVRELLKSKNFAPDSSDGNASVPSVFSIPARLEKLMTDPYILVKTICQKYPPRRGISAVRHFPLHFERDMAQHTKDERIRAQASSESSSLRSHVKLENNDEKIYHSVKVSALESEEASEAESNVSCKYDYLPTLNSGDKSKDKCQSSYVKRSHESQTGNKLVGSNMNLVGSDGDPRKEIVVCEANGVGIGIVVSPEASGSRGQYPHASDNSVNRESDLANEDNNLRSESSHSTKSSLALRAQPVSIEIIDLEDECSRGEFSSKIVDNNVIVNTSMAAPNLPWRHNKVVNPSSPNGIRKSDEMESGFVGGKKNKKGKKLFDERRAFTSLSKNRRGCTNYTGTATSKVSYPCVTAVEVKGVGMASCEPDEGSDDVDASLRTYDVDLVPIVPDNAETQNDSADCISNSKVRETKRRYKTVFRKSVHEEGAISIRGAMSGRKRDDHVLGKILEDQYTNTCEQNVRPVAKKQELASNLIKKLKRSDLRHGICLHDISNGTEQFPIRAINTIDDQLPPSFEYVTSMVYPDWCRPLPLRGCNCIGGCSDSPDCACAVRNDGKIPFDSDGCNVEMKPHGLVYECGPSCKCPPSCPNRVSQFGIRFQLEIFKTESRGWGVRSRNYVPSGSFICEYLGELLEDKQAEQRIDSDEYLFDIRTSFGGSEDMEVIDDIAFTIDAKRYGNIGRFINHGCSPNLYAQHVLYDHENRRVAHVMFFAVEDIPPLQELNYDYNYNIGEVFDANGNVKIKHCFCGSEECTGRMY